MQSTLRDVSGIIQFQFLLEANILAPISSCPISKY